MFFIFYIVYKLFCIRILINKGEYKNKPICSSMVIFISVLFYVTFACGGVANAVILLGSFIVYFALLLIIKNFKLSKYLAAFNIINIIEWFTIFIPTYIMYFNNMVFFSPSDYELYFILWKIYG